MSAVSADLREEWATHAARLQSLGVEIPKDATLVTRNEKDGGVALWIPTGKSTMGSRRGNNDEKPEHNVHLDAFYMDVNPITNTQFSKFARDVGISDWRYPAGFADHPVIGVNWNDASAYCEWSGKRLPTEAEWEKSARGTDGRTYPWGADYDSSVVNGLGGGRTGTSPVGSMPEGASPYGVLEMSGNLWEWVADWYDATYYNWGKSSNPSGPDDGGHRVVRGGSWICHANYLRCAKRDHHEPTYRGRFIGIRCAG